MFYGGLSREEILKIYEFVISKRKELGYGQHKLHLLVKNKFDKEINESTISGWIFRKIVPFANEKTQFKAKKKPEKEELYDLYIKHNQSAEKLSKKYNVSTIIVINWLKYYGIKTRTHLESMNTSNIKKELREKKLRRPTKEFSRLSPEKAYILGVLCGDGCINNKMAKLEIRKDKEFIEEFANCLKEVYGLEFKPYYYEKRNSFIVYAASEIVCKDLLGYGKFGTFEWNIPKEVLISNEKIKTNFLRGMFDSEGSVNKSVITMASANLKGLNSIKRMLKKVGIMNTITTRGKYSYLYICGREKLKTFKEKIGFTIKRKQERLNLF